MSLLKLSCPSFFFFFFSDATNVQPWLMMETGREKIADTNTMLLPKLKAEKDTDCLSIYQSTVFFSLCMPIWRWDTHGSNRWLGGVRDRKKMLDEFSFLACSSNYLLPVSLENERTNERANNRFIKAFPSLLHIDGYKSSTANKHDMLFLCVSPTYIHRHMKKCGNTSVHTRNWKGVKEYVSKRDREREKRREMDWKETLVLLLPSECQVI